MILHVEKVSFAFEDRMLVQGVDLDCAAGEVLGLIGPNGAGKSTLLKLIAGILAPSEGSIFLNGKPLAAMSGVERARAIAYLPQEGEVAWPVAVETLVSLGRLPHRLAFSESGTAPAVTRALSRVDAQHLRHARADRLSAGERARVLLARALAAEAKLLLADEPVAALDPLHQLQVMETLRNEAKSGAAVIVVLHDLTLAARFCDRVLLLDRGKRIAAGKPDQVLTPTLIGSIFAIEAHVGTHGGESFVLPWKPLTRERD